MRRSGFTLLEVTLALGIAVLLLGALYVAVDLQLRFAQAGRDRVENSNLSRAIFSRITADTTFTIGLPDTARFRQQAIAAAAASSSTTTTTSGSSTTGSSTTSGSSTTGSSTSGSSTGSTSTGTIATPLTNTANAATFTNGNGVEVVIPPFGIMGTDSALSMFVSKVPREMLNAQLQQQENDAPIYGDVRRVSYWYDPEKGLVRQEIKVLTSDDSGVIDLSTLPPSESGTPDTISVISEDVKSLQFEYYDGQDWITSWDSTQFLPVANGGDGVTPQGSPVAIRITLTIQEAGKKDPTTYKHVIVIATANGNTPMPIPTTGNSTTGGGTTSP